MIPNIPFWIYKLVSTILKKGGWPLLVTIVTLISQGVIKTVKDLKKYLNKFD